MSSQIPEPTSVTSSPSHEDYTINKPIWNTIDDCVLGEDAVKDAGELYLHKTTGMKADPLYGQHAYDSYKFRANFPNYPLDFLLQLFGLLWQKEPQICVPDEMEKKFLPAPSFSSDKSFMDIYRDTSTYVLKYARHGILLDVPNTGVKRVDTYPILIQYDTYQIKHWGTTTYKGQEVLKFVLLDESTYSYENESLSRELVPKFRFLGLKTTDENGNELESPIYYSYVKQKTFGNAIFNPPFDPANPIVDFGGTTIVYPNINGKFMDRIPFFCFGATSLSINPERPIIYPLCKASLSIYRTDADYREYLYKQGFAILFGTGMDSDQPIYVGSQKAILTAKEDARLEYVSTDGVGLSEYRLAIENGHKYATSIGFNLLKNSGDESGQSVMRQASIKTASLKSIAKTMAYGFVLICKAAAKWRGLSEEDINTITIIPNTEFSAAGSDTGNLVNIWSVYQNSDILSSFDMYNWLRKNEFTTYNTYEEWKKNADLTRKELEDRKAADAALKEKSMAQKPRPDTNGENGKAKKEELPEAK